MQYYLISPRIDGQTTEGYIEQMFSQHIVMMGWGTDRKIGADFQTLKRGDFVLVAQRVNWKFNYYFAGVISDDCSYMEDGCQCRKLKHFIDLRDTKVDFLEDASFAEMRVIKAMMSINPYNNKAVINKLHQIIQIQKNKENMEKYISLLGSNYNLILTGAPGTGKTYLAKQIAAQLILGKEYDESSDEDKKRMDEQSGFVQFHPSYDYTDFIEGLRPIDDGIGNVSFRREDGTFMKFCRKALEAYMNADDKDNAAKYVFIIDEINRGELSKIFGELFFSIDPGYRGETGKVKTQYSNLWKEADSFAGSDAFFIPKNVYIIGTMNDIDRSVESMDFAMRRRFAFKEILASDTVEMIKSNDNLKEAYPLIKECMKNLNLCILTIQGFSSAYQIGAAYFLKLANYLENGELSDKSWEDLWNNHLQGLLFEYLRGLPNADKELIKLYRAYSLEEKYKFEEGKVVKDE